MATLIESSEYGRVVERRRVPARQAGPAGPGRRTGPAVRRAARRSHVRSGRFPQGRPRPVSAPRQAPVVACGDAPGLPGWLTTLAIGAFIALFVLGFGLIAGVSGVGAPVPTVTKVVYVRPGDTVWSIARDAAPASAPDAVVRRIESLNGLPAAALHPGEALRVPDSRSH